jgi:hypothetical protein
MMDLRVSSTRSVCVCTTIPSAAWVLHPIWGSGSFDVDHAEAALAGDAEPGW